MKENQKIHIVFYMLCTGVLISHHVRTDSLYGMKTFFLVSACSDRAEMTFPRVSRDLLMLAPSYNDTKKCTVLK